MVQFLYHLMDNQTLNLILFYWMICFWVADIKYYEIRPKIQKCGVVNSIRSDDIYLKEK